MGLFNKRSREEYGEVIDHINMSNYLQMFLSQRLDVAFTPSVTTTAHQSNNRVFECKTCSRQFPSFQALGGHRASHKRPRLMTMTDDQTSNLLAHGLGSSPPKPKTHECSICGLEFGIGQALGGHMRRHRVTTMVDATKPIHDGMVKRSTTSSKRIVCLDLNLTPLENDLEFRLGGKKVIASIVG